MSDVVTTVGAEDFIRQELKLSIIFNYLPNAELYLLKKWLEDALELSPEELQQTEFVEGEEDAEARAYLTACMLVTCLLLQVGRMPVFDPPAILKFERIEGEQGKYSVDAVFKKLRATPDGLYKLAVKSSLEICQFMATNPDTAENRNKVYRHVQQKPAKAIRQILPSGKSTVPVLKVAHAIGIPIEHLGGGAYQLGWGSKARWLDRSSSGGDSAIGARLSNDKVATAAMLRQSGLPAPFHLVVTSVDQALRAADQIGYPQVVKPADRDRGEGVTIDVSNEDELPTAVSSARELSESRRVILEKQVAGVCHRLFIANDSLLYAVKRLPMGVRGDGRATVAQLVEREVQLQATRPPWARTEIMPVDEMAEQAMALAGFTPQSVPKDGELVPLRRIESTQWGGVDEEVSGQVHPHNQEVAIKAARIFGLQVAGVDIICSDISVPWYESDAIINEVNYAPLFGGGEISRSAIPTFFERFIEGKGTIPVELFSTDQSKEAKNRQRELSRQGIRCYLTSDKETLGPDGEELRMNGSSAQDRAWALLLMSDTDAVVVIRDGSE
jgi:D-alanine-D-alanine ligase-like ATP-grasp enzyme